MKEQAPEWSIVKTGNAVSSMITTTFLKENLGGEHMEQFTKLPIPSMGKTMPSKKWNMSKIKIRWDFL